MGDAPEIWRKIPLRKFWISSSTESIRDVPIAWYHVASERSLINPSDNSVTTTWSVYQLNFVESSCSKHTLAIKNSIRELPSESPINQATADRLDHSNLLNYKSTVRLLDYCVHWRILWRKKRRDAKAPPWFLLKIFWGDFAEDFAEEKFCPYTLLLS